MTRQNSDGDILRQMALAASGLRRELKLSVEQIARRAGVSVQVVREIEAGTRDATLSEVMKLSRALDNRIEFVILPDW